MKNDLRSEYSDLKSGLLTNIDDFFENDLVSLHKKLQEVKQQRKKIEKDAKILENRVNHLQNQEKIVNYFLTRLLEDPKL